MPSGPWIIRRPVTHTPLVLADSRAAAFDVAAREAIDRDLELMVECDGTLAPTIGGAILAPPTGTARQWAKDGPRPTAENYRPSLDEIRAVIHAGRGDSIREARAVVIRDAEEQWCAERRGEICDTIDRLGRCGQ